MCQGVHCVHADATACGDVPEAGEEADAAEVGPADVAEETTPKDTAETPAETVVETTEVAGDEGEASIYCQDVAPDAKPIGYSCTDDCECATGLCYDEAYTAPKGICTRECVGGKSCADDDENLECLVFPVALEDKYGLTVMSICMPLCWTVSDCTAYSSDLTVCSPMKQTQWEGYTIFAQSTCQTGPK